MKHFAFEKNWDEIKAQLKQRFGQLTDDDLRFIAGKGEELLARLREKLGLSAEDLNDLLEELKAGITNRMKQVKAKAAGLASEVREEACQCASALRRDGEDYVRHNPREALLGALCAGFVAGLLIRN